jgi:ATP-dependent Zn protease
MTFAPQQSRGASVPSATARTVIFWVMMIALAVFLWRMASNPRNPPGGMAMSYSDFMTQLEKSNIAAAKLLEGRSTTQVQGQLRQPATQTFTVTIPNETIPDLMQRLRNEGAVVDVNETAGANPASTTSLLINLAPLLVILLLAIFIFRMRRNQRNRSQQGTPANRPLG